MPATAWLAEQCCVRTRDPNLQPRAAEAEHVNLTAVPWDWPKNFYNIDGMSKFLERYKLPKLIQQQRSYLNSSISFKEIEFVVKNIPMNNSNKTSRPISLH